MMKKLICILIAAALFVMPFATFAQEGEVQLAAIAGQSTVEVGDQFLVEVVKNDEAKFLTFRVNGTFDSSLAELVAPVYTNEKLGILTNKFDNEKGTFLFEGYDQTIRGTDEKVVVSLLFEAKKSGEFKVDLLDDCMLGKADENAFYTLDIDDASVTIAEDSNGESVSIIEDAKPLTSFDDMFGYDWAEKAVGVMETLGVTKDIADKSYYPAKEITRGEFITMLMRVCKQKSTKSVEDFLDVDKDSYQYEYIMTAKALGIAKGDSEGNFRPDENISRQDVCSLVYRTMLKMNKVNPEIDTDAYLAKFTDKDTVAPYAVECVAGLVRAKILQGDDKNLIRPEDNMTRAEAAVLLNKLAEFNILVSRG